MSSPKGPTDLSALTEQYEIVGAIRGRDDAQGHLARRRAEGDDVLVLVFHAPADDRGNALAQLASDTHLLRTVRHENAVPVLEGRWVGRDAYALVLERVDAPTLDELIAREEGIAYQRIAAILQEINSVLVWARGQGIVHRGVTLHTVHVEPETNRVWVSFAVRPIPMTGVPDETDDARTIARMAWAMIMGEMPTAEQEKGGIAAVRPALSTRVAADIDAVLRCRPGEESPDVPAFISVVAMADALRQAEDEVARLEAEFHEVLRTERAKWDAEREEAAARAAEAEAEFKRQVAEFEKDAQKRRDTLASDRGEMEERLTRERDQLAKDNARLEAARTDVDAKRMELEKRIKDLEARRAEVERERATEKKKLASEWRELDRLRAALPAFAAEAAGGEADLDAERIAEESFDSHQIDEAPASLASAPSPDEPRLDDPIMAPLPPIEALPSLAARPVTDGVPNAEPAKKSRAHWAFPAAAVILVAIVLASAFGLGRGGDDDPDAAANAPPAAAALPVTAESPDPAAIDSAAVVVGQPADSNAGAAGAASSPVPTPPAAAPAVTAPRRQVTPVSTPPRADSTVGPPAETTVPAAGTGIPTSARADSVRRAARADSLRRDSLARPRPDTIRVPPDTGVVRLRSLRSGASR